MNAGRRATREMETYRLTHRSTTASDNLSACHSLGYSIQPIKKVENPITHPTVLIFWRRLSVSKRKRRYETTFEREKRRKREGRGREGLVDRNRTSRERRETLRRLTTNSKLVPTQSSKLLCPDNTDNIDSRIDRNLLR